MSEGTITSKREPAKPEVIEVKQIEPTKSTNKKGTKEGKHGKQKKREELEIDEILDQAKLIEETSKHRIQEHLLEKEQDKVIADDEEIEEIDILEDMKNTNLEEINDFDHIENTEIKDLIGAQLSDLNEKSHNNHKKKGKGKGKKNK